MTGPPDPPNNMDAGNHEKQPNTTSNTSVEGLQALINDALQQQASRFEAIIAGLQEQIANASLGLKPTHTSAPANRRKSAPPGISRRNSSANLGSASKSKGKARASAVQSQATPKSPVVTKRRHPIQMLTHDAPKDFKSTKEALYLLIKAMWGLCSEKDVPPRVDQHLLKEFYAKFSSVEEVEVACARPGGGDLIPQAEVLTLRRGQSKLQRGMMHMSEYCILYIRSLLAKLGIRVWGPNLSESPDSLFNSACRIVALKAFREAAVGCCFPNILLKFIENKSLLHRAYNHYVHYHVAQRFKKETQESGCHQKDVTRKAIQKNRERLRDARYKYGVNNGFPNRYLKILNDVRCHSDDEYNPSADVFVIKTLGFRSRSANIFMRQLDVAMLKDARLNKTPSRKRTRKLPKVAVESSFNKPPLQMPIDFYSAKWFKGLQPGDKQTIPDCKNVAFLPEPQYSLLPKRHADEEISDRRFTEKYRDILIKPYGLEVLQGQKAAIDEVEGSSDTSSSFAGDSSDFEMPSQEEDEEEAEYYDYSEGTDHEADAGKEEEDNEDDSDEAASSC